ncbi:hypothetical protein Goari_018346 [Gossypium aridum]|uniref:Uncharacterized protein n=2 Tax=Gossypium TaxID=3633 RepID=A0A7J8WPV0_GOSAI|nr:hypothetical protein [Gossypium aridum]
MFIRVVATGDKTWAPSSDTLHSEFFLRMLTMTYLKRMRKKM